MNSIYSEKNGSIIEIAARTERHVGTLNHVEGDTNGCQEQDECDEMKSLEVGTSRAAIKSN